ncbi:MAG: GAF domain-containing protein, partial [Anaerolineae bacterium]
VVNLTKDQFDLYHVHIYLVNEAGDQLDLVVGAGDVGQQMVAQGRSIPLQQTQSLVAQAARSGQGLIENDVLNNPSFLPHPLLPDTRSEAAVPVILRGRVIGVLDVQSEHVDTFTEQDIQIQTMLAAHIAIALENARSYEQAVTSLVETEALLDITKETSQVLELASITDNVLDKVLTATNFDAGLITIVNPDTQKLEVKSHRLPEQFWNMLQENGLDGTLCDLVFHRREGVVVVDMAADSPVDVTGLISLGYKSYQGVPLESQGEVLGTLCLFGRQSLTSEKANSVFLQAAGRQVGIAIRNVALLEQAQMALSEAQQSRQLTQEYLDIQRVLHEINIELFRIDDLDELYRSAIELAHTRLGFERVGMYLLNESNDLLLGTYGVDAEGNICDEKGPEYAIDQKGTIDTFVLNRTRLVVEEDIDLWSGKEVVGRGWHIGAAMWTEDSPIGVIFADNLLTGKPLKPYQSELLFAYGQQMVAEGRQIPLKQEQSLVARAARSRQGVIINDVQAEPGFLPHPLLPETRAEMAVPLITGEQVLGVLDVQSDRLNYFTKEDISTFTTLAAQTAVALQNARFFTQSEERAEELALINRIVTQMNTIQDVKASLQSLVEELGAATQAGSAVVNLINTDGTAQEVVAAYLQEGMPDPVGTVIPIEGDPMMAQLLETRQTLAVDDVASIPYPPEIRDLILQSGFRSLYIIPMFAGRDLIGSATISVLQGGEPLTPDQIRLAETLVFQATSVVQNIRLYAQTEQRETLLRTIIDSTPDWIFVKDRDHRYQMVNKGYADSFHIAPQDFIGKNDLDIGFPEDIVKGNPEKGIRGFWADDVEIMESGQMKVVDIEPAVVDGEQRYLHTIKAPLKDADGQVTAVIGFVHDITDRIQIEETLRQNEAELSQALKIAKLA